MDELIALISGNKPESFWLYFGLMASLAAFGLYQGNRGNIVVFANYTDVLCTILSLVLPTAVLFALQDSNMTQSAQRIIFLIPILFVAKATFSYNRNVFGLLLSLFTKYFLVAIYILALVLVVALALGGDRKKYERQGSYSRRQKGMAIAGALAATGIFAVLSRLGLHSTGFVPLSHYLSGTYPVHGD